MKTIDTREINAIYPLEGTSEWYYGLETPYIDLCDAQMLHKDGRDLPGNSLCLVRYPDGTISWPFEKKKDVYFSAPVYHEEGIYILKVDFTAETIGILRFDCTDQRIETQALLGLDAVKDCYNLKLHVSPPTLTRQAEEFSICWPEQKSFRMDPHETFFLRDGDRLYFNHWYEEGEGEDYRYHEECIVRDLNGEVVEVLKGDLKLMPNGETWFLK